MDSLRAKLCRSRKSSVLPLRCFSLVIPWFIKPVFHHFPIPTLNSHRVRANLWEKSASVLLFLRFLSPLFPFGWLEKNKDILDTQAIRTYKYISLRV